MLDIYKELNKKHLCKSKQDFHRRWLCVDNTYLRTRQGEGKGASLNVLFILWRNLLRVGEHELAGRVHDQMNALAAEKIATY